MLILIKILFIDIVFDSLYAINFGVGNRSSVHANNWKKYYLVPSEQPTQLLDDAKITAETNILLISLHQKINCLNLQCTMEVSFSYVNGVKLYQLKVKYSEIKPYLYFLFCILVFRL